MTKSLKVRYYILSELKIQLEFPSEKKSVIHALALWSRNAPIFDQKRLCVNDRLISVRFRFIDVSDTRPKYRYVVFLVKHDITICVEGFLFSQLEYCDFSKQQRRIIHYYSYPTGPQQKKISLSNVGRL